MLLRPYQQEAIDAIVGSNGGLVVMATGTGKTFTMAVAIARMTHEQPVIWLAHRGELVEQARRVVPRNVFCETIQTAARHSHHWTRPHILVIDEAHHAAAKSYGKVIETLKPDKVYGLTATPNRADRCSLSNTFDKIVYEYDMVRAVEDGHLARPMIRQIRTKVDLSQVSTKLGDYDTDALRRAIDTDSRNHLIAQVVSEMPKPAMVFCVDLEHVENITKAIPGSVGVSGKTKKSEREEYYKRLLSGELPCLVNCELYTEGADFPNLRTVVLARPTQSQILYIQMAGRVLRKLPDKQEGWIVDLVDATNKFPACQAPTLIGLDPAHEATGKVVELRGDLLRDIPVELNEAYCTFEAIIQSDRIISDWARRVRVDLRGISWMKKPNGTLYISVPGQTFTVRPMTLTDSVVEYQRMIDAVYYELAAKYGKLRPLWDKRLRRSWNRLAPSNEQLSIIKRFEPAWAKPTLTRGEASKVISFLLSRGRA